MGKLVAGLATAGAAAAMLPASAGATTCVGDFCGPGVQGLTHAFTVLETNPSNGNDAQAASVILDRLAANHNETVLTLA